MWILTRRSPQDCSVRVHITTVAAVRWATDLCGSLSRILAVSWSQCVRVCVSPVLLLPVSVTRVSPVCPRSSAQSGWVWAHAGDACTTAFLFSSATCLLPACCLLPAACCLPAACHVLRFSTAAFSPPLVATPFPTFYFTRVRAPRVFSAHLIFSRNATQTQHPWC